MIRRAVMLAVIAVALGIGWNALQAGRQGWVPEGDGAIITLRTHDVFTTHPPLLGNPTTAGQSEPGAVYHPGPLEFAVLAIPLRFGGANADGMLAGAAAINMLAVAGIVVFAYRRRGPSLAAFAAFACSVLVWALGDEIPHDSYNPHIVILPLALLIVLAWSLSCGDLVALPVAVVAGSLVAQSHAYDAIPVVALAIFVVVMLVRHRQDTTRRRGLRCSVLASLGLGVALWTPPIVDQLIHRPGNFRQLIAFATDGSIRPQGFAYAWHRLADYVAPSPRWLDRDPSFFALNSTPSPLRQALCVAILAGAVLLAMRARRDGRSSTALLLVTAFVALAGSTFAAARLPAGTATSLAPYNHRHWWASGMIAWLAIGWALAEEVRIHIGPRVRRAFVPVAAAATVLVVIVAVQHVTIANDRGSASFGTLSRITPPVAAAVAGKGPVLVTGDGAQAFTSIEPGIVSALVLRGIDARVDGAEAKVFGSQHVVDGSMRVRIVIRSGADAATAPPGGRLVAMDDPSADLASGRFTNAGVSGKVELIAVYIIDG